MEWSQFITIRTAVSTYVNLVTIDHDEQPKLIRLGASYRQILLINAAVVRYAQFVVAVPPAEFVESERLRCKPLFKPRLIPVRGLDAYTSAFRLITHEGRLDECPITLGAAEGAAR